MDLNRAAPLNVVVVMNLEHSSPLCVHCIVRKLHDAGHHITLFGKGIFRYRTIYQ